MTTDVSKAPDQNDPADPFAAELASNAEFAARFAFAGMSGQAAKGLLVLTCMDTRLAPLMEFGLRPGDAKILRNAGGRVTDEMLDTIVLSHYLLGVERVMVLAHTDCRMASGTEADVHAAIAAAGGPDTRSLRYLTTDDQVGDLRADVQRIRSSPYLPGLVAGGFVYDVSTGRVEHVV